ncbi:MAG TPA: hypothetical protein VFI31_13450 [Pirellulales bacterium]|nr:hypothetical protein [Pirellulales bacterium]
MQNTAEFTQRSRTWRRSPVRPLRPETRKKHLRKTRSQTGQAERTALYYDVAAILFVGAVCGVFYGLTCGWQIAVESAQVVAGVVEYPPDNPFYMYHVKSWTLLHQLPALLLKCGVSEAALSMGIACTAATLFLQSLGLICYSFCRDRLLASAVPMVYLATNVVKGCGAVYPIFIIPNEYWTSYGVTGTACALFAWSLWGLGLRRPAAFVCGLSPAVHPALGAWCIAITTVALVWTWITAYVQRRQPMQNAKWKMQNAESRAGSVPALRWFVAGAGVTVISFLTQQYLARGLPPADPVLSQKLLAAFVEGWDNHRVPFPLTSVDCQYGWCLLTLTAAAHAWFAGKLPRESRLLLRILLVSALGSMALCIVTHVSRWLPMAVMMAMPGRFINLAVLAYPATLLGLLARGRRAWSIELLLASLSLYCLLRTLMLSQQLIYVPAAHKVFIASGYILIYLLASQEAGSARVRGFVRYAALACLGLAGFLWMRDLHLALLLWLAAPALWLFQNRLGDRSWFRLGQALGRPSKIIYQPQATQRWLGQKLAGFDKTTGKTHGRPAMPRWLAYRSIAAMEHEHQIAPTGAVLPQPPLARYLVDYFPRTALWASTLACLWLAFAVKSGYLLTGGCFLAVMAAVYLAHHLPMPARFHLDSFGKLTSRRHLAALASIAVCLALISVALIEQCRAGSQLLAEAENDPALVAARRQPGMLLAVPRMCLVQLRTRRPVLLNGEAMNQITYVPQSGPAMNHIVKRVYGDDILTPRPRWWQNWGGLMEHSAYDLWQSRDAEEWRRLSREFGFTNIVTSREWTLQLPVVARSDKLILYGVP